MSDRGPDDRVGIDGDDDDRPEQWGQAPVAGSR